MSEVYKRNVRIVTDGLAGATTRIEDYDTKELIPNVLRATIHLSAIDINTAELTYYETDERGNLIVKGNDVVVGTITVENPAVDVTAMERCHAHIGGYDITYEGCGVPGKPHVFLTIGDDTRTAVQFYPDEALELLKWLQQERPNLEQLAKTCNASRRSVKVEEVVE